MIIPVDESAILTRPSDALPQVDTDPVRYELVRSAILTFLHARGPLSAVELERLVEDAMLPAFDESVVEYFIIVKHDLEASGKILRERSTDQNAVFRLLKKGS
jgi:hypothetical protein